MEKFGKRMFGRGLEVKTEVTNGTCPICDETTIFVSIFSTIYRCISCGADTEQKVNGVIKFMPIGQAGMKDPPLMKLMEEGDSDKA